MKPTLGVTWFLVLAIGLSGCGGGSAAELVPVEGLVTLDGVPLVDAEVTFRPASGRPSAGRTNAEGRYRLQYMPGEFGAIGGQHTVAISTQIEPDSDSSDPVRQKGRPETVPAIYNRKTKLLVTLPSGKEPGYDFLLEKKPKVAGTAR